MRTFLVVLALGGLGLGFGTDAAADVPEALDREMITKAVKTVKPEIAKCGTAHPDVKGTVKATVKVSPDGKGTVTIKATPNEALGECVAVALKKVTFGKTTSGGSFSYPFVF